MAAPQFAVDIRDYLVSVGITPVQVGFLTDLPINQFSVVEYQGTHNVKTMGPQAGTVKIDKGNIQIMVRHTSAQTALTNVMLIVDTLDGLQEVTINGVFYTYITMNGRPRILDRFASGAVLYIAEFYVESRR